MAKLHLFYGKNVKIKKIVPSEVFLFYKQSGPKNVRYVFLFVCFSGIIVLKVPYI